ncbi:hypothetical protein [Nocardiopsis deserti]|uniref:hypothetical protein n=1 Tax=Nocardiopsis deserti TaxID=2605988 RepID=UPI00123A6050|nr:hypothetical protein [Nocardiopsis deserti]
MNGYGDRERDMDEELEELLLNLPTEQRERLFSLVVTGMEPKVLIGPLTERVSEAVRESTQHEFTKADVKEAVRRALVENMQARRTHLSQLAQLVQHADAVDEGGDHAILGRKIDDFCRTTGLRRISDTEDLSLYRVVSGNPETGKHVTVLKPAFVDEISGQLVIAGEIRFSDVPRARKSGKRKDGWA